MIVEFEAQSRIEGEVQQLPSSFPVTELSAVLSGKAAGRTSERDVTIFDSVGFALEDFSTLRYLYRLQNAERGAHQQIDLVPDLEDPKNLFARLAARVNNAHVSGRFAVAQRA